MRKCDNCNAPTKKYKSKYCAHLFCSRKCYGEYKGRVIPIVVCNYCKSKIKKHKTGKTVFCNLDCKTRFSVKKYDHLFNSFKNHPNEVAYLFGLIMGDGHLKKDTKYTTRISIAFNIQDKKSLKIAKSILNKLKIIYFIEPATHRNCLMLGFMTPDSLLMKYNLLFHGNKFKVQPICPRAITNNLNFCIGLLNSDGCRYKRKKRNKYKKEKDRWDITFCNTVESIVSDMEKCLSANNIKYSRYEHIYVNQPTWKKRITINIAQKLLIDKISKHKYSKWRS